MLKICVAGATGWTGSAITEAVLDADDLTLSGAVARATAGQDVGQALGRAPAGVTVAPTVGEALAAPCDVLIDYSHPRAVLDNVMTAIGRGVAVVVGTSGLTAADYAAVDHEARRAGIGVVASGNFSLTAALLQHCALLAARHIGHFEVIDYASAGKPDAPSGTAGELAERLGAVRQPETGVPLDKMIGPKEIRGAEIAGVRVHSLRLPSFTASVEAVFAVPGARLTLRHDAGESAQPYVEGTLIAARRVGGLTGLVRGLDSLLFGTP